MPAEITARSKVDISRVARLFGHIRAISVVADNTLTIKQKSTLPVSKTRQDKSLFCSLPDTYPPPRPHGLPPHLRHYYPPPAPACARRPFCTTTCAAATAACGPGAKVDLAYTTGPFPVPRCPAGASRTTGALILYGAMGGRRHRTASGSSLKSAAAGCEPFLVNSLLPGPLTCTPAASVTDATSRCEPIPAFPLLPGPSTCPA